MANNPYEQFVNSSDSEANPYAQFVDAPKPKTEKKTPKTDESWLAREGRLILGIGGDADLRSSVIGRTMEGMARPGAGVAQLLSGGSPEVTNEINRRRAQAESSLSSDETNIAGYVGEALSPTTMIPASKIPIAASLLGKSLQSAGVGGVAALASPVKESEGFADKKTEQVLTSLVASGLIPPALAGLSKLGGVAYRVAIEPWLDPASIKGRALINAAGDKYDEIVGLLRNPEQIVKGSAPNAGEAAVPAGSTGFSALQKDAAEVPGIPADAYMARTDAQNTARINALKTIGQDEKALNQAIGERSAVTRPMYEAARKGGPVDVSTVVSDIDSVIQNNPGNPALVATFAQIKNGLIDPEGNVRTDPQQISSAIDGIKAALANKDNAFIKGELTDAKNKLIDLIPGYKPAQTKFAELSEPVNQMQVGQYLEKKLVPALDEQGRQKSSSFATAVADSAGTIKRATGAPRFDKLSEVLTPEQMSIVNGVQADLARIERLGTLARAGKKSEGAFDIASQSMEEKTGGKVPQMLNRVQMVANAILTRAEGKVNKKLATELALEMLDPVSTANTMVKTKAKELRHKEIVDAIMKYRFPASAGLTNVFNEESQ